MRCLIPTPTAPWGHCVGGRHDSLRVSQNTDPSCHRLLCSLSTQRRESPLFVPPPCICSYSERKQPILCLSLDFIRTGMFGRTGNEVFHCFTAEIPSSVCRAEWLPEECENPVHGSAVSMCRQVMVLKSVCAPAEASFLNSEASLQDTFWRFPVSSWMPAPMVWALGAHPTALPPAFSDAISTRGLVGTFHYVHSQLCFIRMEGRKSWSLRQKKKKINTDVGSLKTWYLVHHEFFLHFYFKVLTLKYHLDY